MAVVAPIGLALGGKLLFGRVGFAVGWLIGSWLYNRLQKKNEVTDTGAEEMPRFNQALRGTTVPVLFGTNRVSSQIVWQHDYTATRADDEAGGGKFGGSGSKGATKSATGDYEYTWDLVYHLGMTREKFTLLRGWLGADPLNDLMISSINSGSGFSAPPEDEDEDDETIISYGFDDAFFYGGDGAGLDAPFGDSGWSEILADEGVGVRWPHTAYIGFKQLALGSFPSIPSFTWEVGPSEGGSFASDPGDIGLGTVSTSFAAINSSPSEFILGEDGRYYFVATERNSEETWHLYRIAEDWTSYALADTVTQAEITTLADDGNTYSNTRMDAFPLGTSHILVCMDASAFVHTYLLLKINASGVLEKVGTCDGSGGFGLMGEVMLCDISGNKTGNDPIIVVRQEDANENYMVVLPGINSWTPGTPLNALDVENLQVSGGGRLDVEFYSASTYSYDAILDHSIANGWLLPGGTGTRMYFFVPRSTCQAHIDNFAPGAAQNNPYIDSQVGTYPNGFVFYLEFTLHPDTGAVTFVGGPTVCNADFGGDVPFDDDSIETDGTTVNHGFAYAQQPAVTKLTEGNQAGAYVVIFSKIYANDTAGEIGNAEKAFATARGFVYNPLTSEYTPIMEVSFVPYNLAVLVPTHTTYTLPGSRKISFVEALGEAWGVDRCVDTNIGANNRTIVYKVGNLTVGQGSDVLPPEIIYEVLTNPVFGIGIDEADINAASYEDAKQYCRDNQFYVSTQYRREQSVLSLIEEVLATYGGFLIRSDSKYVFKQLEWLNGSAAPIRTIDNNHLVRERADEPPVRITKGALQDTFNKVRVNYIDRALDYAQNQVEESDEVDQDLQGIRMREFPPQFVMSEGMARTMALRALWGNLYARDTYEFTLGWKDADLEPGDVITLVDSFHAPLQAGVTCRIVRWAEKKRGLFEITAKQEFEYILTTSAAALDITSGDFVNPYSKVSGPKAFKAYELPYEFQTTDVGQVYIGWAANQFAAGAYIWMSPDGTTYSEVAKVSPYAIWGTLLSGLPNDPGVIENAELVLAPSSSYASSADLLYNDTLAEATQGVRAVGASLLWVGSEMIAYQGVTLIAQNKYRIARLFRGWGGTEIGAHSSGDIFWKHAGGIYAQEFNRDSIGNTFAYKVQPYNLTGGRIAIESINAQTYTIVGRHYAPHGAPTPRLIINSEDLRGKTRVNVGSAADIFLEWRERARYSGYGTAGYGTQDYGRFTPEVHYPASNQNYRAHVAVVGSGGVVVRSTTVSAAEYLYTNSQNFADNGAWRGNVAFRITPEMLGLKAGRVEVCSLELWQ